MAQAQTHSPSLRRFTPVEGFNDSQVDKVQYLLTYLMAGLSEEGSCKISKREFMRAFGMKRFGKDAYKFIYEHMPKHKVQPTDVRILEVGGDVMLIDANRLETFSSQITASEDN